MRMYVYMHIKIHVYIYLRTNENTRKHRTQRLKKAFCLIGFDSIMWNLHSPFFHVHGFWRQKHVFQLQSSPKTAKGSQPCLKMKKPPFAFLSSTSPSQKARITENCALKHSPPTSGVGRDRLCLTSDNTKPQIPNCRPRTSTLSTLILPHFQLFWVPRTLRMAASTKLIAACWSWAASTCTIQVPKGQKGLENDKLGICRAFWGSHEFEPHPHRCTLADISEMILQVYEDIVNPKIHVPTSQPLGHQAEGNGGVLYNTGNCWISRLATNKAYNSNQTWQDPSHHGHNFGIVVGWARDPSKEEGNCMWQREILP